MAGPKKTTGKSVAARSKIAARDTERSTGAGRQAAREALGRKNREAAKRTARYERGQRGEPGARSREPLHYEH